MNCIDTSEEEAFEAFWEEQEKSRLANGGNFEGPCTCCNQQNKETKE